MSDVGIFAIKDGLLSILGPTGFETEDVFQKALADHPEVLAAGATTEGGERRLLLLRREKGIPTSAGGSDVFSVDHLFLDSDGVPVVVEVKRSSDTRLRREVVGQMLDYVANGARYWSAADLRQEFESRALSDRKEPGDLIDAAFPNMDPEDLWQRVDQNLKSGHLRMVFVADHLPDELVTVIEFLNEQMTPAEVLGIELQHFTDGSLRVLVPRLVGATSAAKAAKQRSTGIPWNSTTFLAEAEKRCSDHLTTFERLFEHAQDHGSLHWGKGQSPGVSGWYRVGDKERGVWTANTGAAAESPYLYIWLPEIRELLDDPTYSDFEANLRTIPAFDTELKSGKHKYPSVYLSQLGDNGLVVLLKAIEGLAKVADLETSGD